MPWLDRGHQEDWHPAEIRFAESWPDRFLAGGRQYGNSLLASQLLSRLLGLCLPPRAVFHSLWMNGFDGICAIQFEWENGPTHAAILDRLLDSMFGLAMEIQFRDGQTTADCYSEEASFVTVRSSAQPATRIALRRLTSDNTEVTAALYALGTPRHARRAAAEERHGDRATRRRSTASTHA